MTQQTIENAQYVALALTVAGQVTIGDNGEGLYLSIDSGTGDLIIDVTQLDDFMTTHINYCPICGRKL